MRTTEERIKRLEIWNRVLLTLAVLFALIFIGNLFHERMQSSLRSLSVYWEPDGEVRFHSVADGPSVVTHLVMYGDSEVEKKTAVLPQPLAIIDSSGAMLTADEAKELTWLNIYGQPTAPPATGSKIKALYFSASTASVAD